MDDLLQQGIAAHKAGKRDEARKIFITAVKQNPDNERAWGGMYEVSGDDKERVYCLKQMLRINPKNEKAKQMLDALTGQDFPFEMPQIYIPPIQGQVNNVMPLAQIQSPEIQNQPMKKCPYCAEMVLAEAQVCRHCGRDLSSYSISPVRTTTTMRCIHCQKEISTNALKCPYCHSDLTSVAFFVNPTYRIIFIVLFLLIGCPCLYFMFSIIFAN